MKRKLVWIVFIGLAASAGIYSWFFLTPDKNINSFYLIPKDAIYIMETSTPVESWNRFSKSEVWRFLKKQEYFAGIGRNADYLDSLVSENSTLFTLFGNRDLIISAHKTRAKDYDFLFLLNLKKGARIGFIEETLEQVLNSSGLKVESHEFKNKTILSAYKPDSQETLYFSIVQNYLICSYSNQLVENAIMEVEDPRLGRDESFLTIYQETSEEGLCKLYINYDQLDEYMQCYSNENEPLVKDLSRICRYSGLKVDVEDEYASLEGYTNINDSTESYLKALMMSGKGGITAQKILPARVAIFHSLGFNSGAEFYKNLQKVLQVDEKAYQEFENNKKQIENQLQIDLERDMLSWVEDEVAYVQTEPSQSVGSPGDILVVMKTAEPGLAKERLDFIAGQVMKRTPDKFKKVDYKNYIIRYLELKGVFRLFFGKMFSKLEKPYYTLVDNYVVFANDPKALLSLIEDFECGNTLAKDEAFDGFLDKFNQESTVFSYYSASKAFPLLTKRMDALTRESAKRNELYFRSFPQTGFQLTEKEDRFYTKARLNFAEYKPAASVESDSAADAQMDATAMLDSLDNIQRFRMIPFEHNVMKEYYENSSQLRLEAETKQGELNGRYREYYDSGELKVYGHHRRGEKKGVWFYYNKDGTLLRKERLGFIGKMISTWGDDE